MKKILLTFLLGFSSLAFANKPLLTTPTIPVNTNIEESSQVTDSKIFSSQNFFITKSYHDNNVPQDLKKWIPWVNKNQYTQDCIDSICVFIPKLTLYKSHHYIFNFEGTSLSKEAWVPLPSSDTAWPISVLLNGQKTIIVNHNGKPFVQVPQKDFKLEAQYNTTIFDKDSSFILPFTVVSFDNQTNQNLSLKDSTLSLNDIASNEEKNSFQEIKVFRKFIDNIPYNLETNIQINFSGKTKELDLGTVLPNDFKLTNINSDLKVIFKNNHYFITIIPGSHFVNFKSFANKEITSFSTKNLINHIENEIWSIQKNNNIRNIDISDAHLVDSKQANVPQEWLVLPAYIVDDKLAIHTSQQGLSFDTDLKINANRQSFFGFNDFVYSNDEVRLDNTYVKELKFNTDVSLQSISFSQPKMILKENNQHYVLLNSHDNSGVIQFDTIKGQNIPSQLTPSYYIDKWTTFFTPRTELIWASNAKITSLNFWFNSWNLYSLFSLSVLIIALYKLIGKEAAIFALFSLVSFYYHHSVFWIFWILLVISYAFNRYLPQKYSIFKHNTNTISLIGTALVVLFSIKFVINEIFSILHPNISTHLSFSPIFYICFIILVGIIYKIVTTIFYAKQTNNSITLSKNSWFRWFVISAIALSIPYFYYVNSITILDSGYSKSGVLTSSLKNINNDSNMEYTPAAPIAMEDSINDDSAIVSSVESSESLKQKNINTDTSIDNSLSSLPQNNLSIQRNVSQEKVQIGHALVNPNNLHSYQLKPSNKDSVHFYVANKWLVNLYGIVQSIFLLLLAYILIIYNVFIFKKEHWLNNLPKWTAHNLLTKKIQSKIHGV